MSTWTLIQIGFNIFVALGLFIVIMRMNRAPKDDPRLSRGLQLLQSKIAVLEDLSDRTENQVSQLTAILEQKAREVQAKVQLAEQHVQEIRVSMERSLEVAKIFQDKIPHQEIIERQNTVKYVQAARLAHQGLGVDEIASRVDLPKGEIEFIASVNRDRLMFSEEQLPDWARTTNAVEPVPTRDAMGQMAQPAQAMATMPTMPTPHMMHAAQMAPQNETDHAERSRLIENLSRLQTQMQSLDLQLARESSVRDLSGAFEVPRVETASLQKLGEEFRKACEAGNLSDSRSAFLPPLEQLTSILPQVFVPNQEIAPATPVPAAPMPMAPIAAPTQVAAMNTMAMVRPAESTTAMAVLPETTATVAVTEGQANSEIAAADAKRDPALARAIGQAKVEAAFRAADAKLPKPSPQEVPPELEAARQIAKEAAAVKPAIHVIGGRSSSEAPVVKKVIFPRIDKETEF